MKNIAYFVTPHGFGHAARASAVITALQSLYPEIQIHLYTKVPEWFFSSTKISTTQYHSVQTDIGLIQSNAFDEDIPQTLSRLDEFLPFRGEVIAPLAAELTTNQCELVICDIAPLGIAVAEQAGIPSVLIENFTWDWIYQGYRQYYHQFDRHISLLRDWFSRASFHVQTTPVCNLSEDADLISNPVSRPVSESRQFTRVKLGVDEKQKTILVTLGGIEGRSIHHQLATHVSPDVLFIIPGAANKVMYTDNTILLPHHHDFYHPDLVNASDAVIGKLGYSTLAECYNTGKPFGFIPRLTFPESPPLTGFVTEKMSGFPLNPQYLMDPERFRRITNTLLDLPASTPERPNGAVQIADFLARQF